MNNKDRLDLENKDQSWVFKPREELEWDEKHGLTATAKSIVNETNEEVEWDSLVASRFTNPSNGRERIVVAVVD